MTSFKLYKQLKITGYLRKIKGKSGINKSTGEVQDGAQDPERVGG